MRIEDRAQTALRDGWQIQGRVRTLGQGLINDTFLVECRDGDPRRWVLQRINPEVFADSELVMKNVARVVRHVQSQVPALVAGLVATTQGEDCYRSGGYWRLWDYVADAITLQSLSNEAQAYSAGSAFAKLQNVLADLPGPRLRTPIPGFMRMSHYLDQLDVALSELPNRITSKFDATCERAAVFVQERRGLATEFQQAGSYVHGDCKVNNLLFRGDRVCCVLDLDTVMYGHWAWDFGDLVRSGVDASGHLSLEWYRGLAEGFVRETHQTVDERSLVLAPRYVGLMLGVRFLADHLCGDRYFRVQNAGDNLARAVHQFDLVSRMEGAEDQLHSLVRELL